MGVTLQAGILASCVVFVPMAMAGWHLTRNRVLFFSGALFIVLAVSVHVFPYFPVLSFTLFAVPAAPTLVEESASASENATAAFHCYSNLHEVQFTRIPSPQVEVTPEEGVPSNDADWDHWDWTWEQEPLNQCQFQKLDREEALQLLQGTRIVVAGDSQARLFFVALLELLLPSIEELRPQLFKRHSNFEYLLESQQMRVEFVWAPYTVNLTQMVWELRQNQTYPDVLVMGTGLWHMLHVGNHTQYGSSLLKLKRALGSLLTNSNPSAKEVLTPQIFWMNLPTLIPALLQSEVKRKQMTSHQLRLYTAELLLSRFLRPEGPVTLLNIQKLSHQCGPQCTQDGIHYSQATYRAALHVMINNLLIATKQAPIT